MIKNILLLFCALILTYGCDSKITSNPKAILDDFGIVQVSNYGTLVHASETATGVAHTYAKSKVIKTTDIIPLKQGVAFGIDWCVEGITSKVFLYQLIIKHPELINAAGKASNVSQYQFKAHPKNGKHCTTGFYHLSDAWEVVEGNWNISVYYDGQLLVGKDFLLKK